MLRVKNLSNAFQKRTIRPLYAQTQATPYAATLDASIGTGASFRAPASGDTAQGTLAAGQVNAGQKTPFARTAAAALIKGDGLMPGTVMVRVTGDIVAVGTGSSAVLGSTTTGKEQPFGLLANFVGGQMDELGSENTVGVWRGPDSTFELLAPAFDTTAITVAAFTAANTGAPIALVCGTDGLLTIPGSAKTAASATATATTTSSTTTLNVPTAGLAVGMTVTGAGISAGQVVTVTSITSTSALVLSAAISSTATAYTFNTPQAVVAHLIDVPSANRIVVDLKI